MNPMDIDVFIPLRLSVTHCGATPSLWVFVADTNTYYRSIKAVTKHIGCVLVEIPYDGEDLEKEEHPIRDHIPPHLKERVYVPVTEKLSTRIGLVRFMYDGHPDDVVPVMRKALEETGIPGLITQDRGKKDFEVLFATDLSEDRFPRKLTETEVAILKIGDSISNMVYEVGKLHTDYLVSLINGINIGLKTLFGIPIYQHYFVTIGSYTQLIGAFSEEEAERKAREGLEFSYRNR